ncbi:CGLAU_01105 family protein [Corynebacterium cystitidis]|uniref:CGLAU_01105 family protein n=1 Tax=Corynebacterium cystitidis TaxID=35757 RepID=UPI00211E2881|nr:CGLAU_01105 family protein [Corynebacterium cystitidis]
MTESNDNHSYEANTSANNESPREEDDSVLDQVKDAVSRARESFGQASNAEEFKQASATFAGDAENIVRDLAGSVSRAAQGAKDSNRVDELITQVRSAFDQAVDQVRERATSTGDDSTKAQSEGIIADMRTRLEGLIGRVSDGFSDGHSAAGAAGAAGAASRDADGVADEAADIIDGEVVDTHDTANSPKEDSH